MALAAPSCAVLVVCTSNQARSPVAAALLRGYFERRVGLADGLAWWPISSAGVDAVPGMPLLESMSVALARAGYAPLQHSSEVLTPGMVEAAHLIVTMTEEHRHRVNRMSPTAVARTFTLKELDRLLLSPRWPTSVTQNVHAVRELHSMRPLVPRGERAEDLADPALGSGRLAEAVLQELILLVGRVASQLSRFERGQADVPTSDRAPSPEP